MDQTEKQTKETDVELLCKYIYDYGEQYMDGTGAITFSKLKQVRSIIIIFHHQISFSYYLFQVFRGSGNVWSAIEQSKKFEVIDHDGDSAHVIAKKKHFKNDMYFQITNQFFVLTLFVQIRTNFNTRMKIYHE